MTGKDKIIAAFLAEFTGDELLELQKVLTEEIDKRVPYMPGSAHLAGVTQQEWNERHLRGAC